MNRFIVGAGLAGLIVSYCSRINGVENTVYAKEVGGQMKCRSFALGPRILHDKPKVREFLKMLGVNEEPREFKVGYCKGSVYRGDRRIEVIEGELSKNQKRDYYRKTRGNGKLSETALSCGKNTIIGWDMQDIKLIDRLVNECKQDIISTYCIDIDENTLGWARQRFDEIVWTAPYAELMKVMGREEREREVKSAFFYLLSKSQEGLLRMKGLDFDKYDYIYNIDANAPEKRYTKTSNGVVVESMEQIFDLAFCNVFEKKTIIAEELKMQEVDGIILQGRYAEMNHGVRADTIIERYMR